MMRALIAADVALMREILEAHDVHVVAEVKNGEEAVAAFRSHRPEIAMLDLMMPQKSGVEVTKQIVALDPRARVVVCGSLGQESLIERALGAGARDFVLKPFSPERVRTTLIRVLEKPPLRRAGRPIPASP
jgi:two-component system chemotaxis response regulator CheY